MTFLLPYPPGLPRLASLTADAPPDAQVNPEDSKIPLPPETGSLP